MLCISKAENSNMFRKISATRHFPKAYLLRCEPTGNIKLTIKVVVVGGGGGDLSLSQPRQIGED